MPQIAQIGEIYSSQLFWLAITFGLIFFGIGLGMLPKIQSTVDARDARIAADLEEAEKARASADRLEEEYRAAVDRARAESARLAAEAKAEAARRIEQRAREVEATLNAHLEEAERRIAEARAAALGELEGVAAEAAQQMVERIADLRVESDAARAAVRKELVHG